jgi:hypothetical protein
MSKVNLKKIIYLKETLNRFKIKNRAFSDVKIALYSINMMHLFYLIVI